MGSTTTKTRVLVAALATAMALGACSHGPDPRPERRIRKIVFGIGAPTVRAPGGDTVQVSEDVAAFYKQRRYAPVLIAADGSLDRADDMLKVLDDASQDGLGTARYRVETAKALRDRYTKSKDDLELVEKETLLADLDVTLTEGFRRYSEDMARGTLDPEAAGVEWEIPRAKDPGVQPNQAVANGAPPAKVIGALRPITPYYGRLRQALGRYAEVAAKGGWPEIGDVGKLEAGQTGPGVQQLRARLMADPDPTESQAAAAGRDRPDYFDDQLVAALAHFQQRVGIAPDSVVGPATREALDVPVDERLQQIRTNMDRWRWMPRDLGSSFILVNVAGQDMEVVEDDSTVIAMNVVVGKTGHETPIFRDTLQNIVVNPYWNVPKNIASDEIIPKAIADPGYLSRNNFEVVSGKTVLDPYSVNWDKVRSGAYTIRQRPGPDNALGTVKFLFPNSHNVYLHDTPADHLFSQTERAFSHGCVRVERPRDLAHLLFRDAAGRDPADFDRMRAEPEEQWVTVKNRMPVYILYLTTWVTPQGEVHFYPDIYKRDDQLKEQIQERLSA